MPLLRERISPEFEQDILTALITNTQFINKTHRWYKSQYFSDYGKVIYKWVVDYWSEYAQAPGKNIQSIWKVKQDDIKPALADNIASYLENLSIHYENKSEFNLDYLVDKTRDYIRKKSYEYLYSHGQDLIKAGQVEDAVRFHESFNEVVKTTSRWENPFDPEVITNHFNELESERHIILQFPGILGQLMGPLERGWLVAFMGPMKRGKSFWIQESLFQALHNKKKVCYINLEMIEKGVRDRQYRRLTGAVDDTEKSLIIPMFDCKLNQSNMCRVPKKRTNKGKLKSIKNEKGTLVWIQDGKEPYHACTYCRHDKRYFKNYVQGIHYKEQENKTIITKDLVLKRAKAHIRQFGANLRSITYPAGTTTIEDIIADMKELEYTDNFIPDMVLLDYADIAGTRKSFSKKHEKIDHIWEHIKGEATTKHSLWITGTQSNADGLNTATLDGTNTPGSITKNAHLDAMFGLNQTLKEKDELYTRINTMYHRHREFGSEQAIVLHQLGLAMPYLDSDWYVDSNKK
jgi:hypothetical protein